MLEGQSIAGRTDRLRPAEDDLSFRMIFCRLTHTRRRHSGLSLLSGTALRATCRSETSAVTRALSILRGRFGRVALLDMDTSLVDHAHPHYHLIFKASGPDQNFVVEGQAVPLRGDTLVAVNSWQQHEYVHRQGTERTLFLALYIEPGWLAEADRSFVNCAEPGFFPRAGIAITRKIDRLRAGVVRRMADPSQRHDELQQLILDLCLNVAY